MFPIQNPQKAITSYIFICKNWWLILILRNFAFFYWWREYYHDCKFYLYMCVSKINFNPTIVLCSTATFAVAILSSLCVEITEPLVRVWRHVRDHAQQVEGEHLVEDDSLLVQTILAQPGRGQQQQLDIFLESLPERILSRAFFAIVLMTRSCCLITAGGLSGWIVTGSKGRSSASAGKTHRVKRRDLQHVLDGDLKLWFAIHCWTPHALEELQNDIGCDRPVEASKQRYYGRIYVVLHSRHITGSSSSRLFCLGCVCGVYTYLCRSCSCAALALLSSLLYY